MARPFCPGVRAKALGGHAPPDVWIVEFGAEFFRGRFAEIEFDFGLALDLADDAVDAAHGFAAFEIGDFARRLRQIFGMFDGFAIHVADVERAVGTVGEIDGAEPVVGRGEKFVGWIRAFRDKVDAVRRQHVVMDEVAGRFAGE